MSAELFIFQSKAELSVQHNLEAFIRRCRHDLTVFGADLEWHAWRWPGVVFSKMGVNSRTSDPSDCLEEPLLSFAKAYLRYQQGHKPTQTRQELLALRAVQAAFSSKGMVPCITKLTMAVLDRAAELAREQYEGAAYHCGRELARLAEFVSRHGLVDRECGAWKNPIKRHSDKNKTGVQGKQEREKKLPSEEAVMGLADIFALCPSDPKDIFISSTFAMLMCAPSRISEVLELPWSCEVEELDSEGELRYGWRFWSKKGKEGNMKWIPSPMVPIAKEAIRRIRELTAESRRLAKWCQENPDRFYRHAGCPAVADDDFLTPLQACAALGYNVDTESNARSRLVLAGFPDIEALTLDELWRHAYGRLQEQKDWPYASKVAGVTYADALFCMNLNMLHSVRGASPVIPWMPDVNTFNNDVSTRPTVEGHKSIFDRYDLKASDGTRLRMTSHQVRHLLNTIAQRGGLSQDDIAAWAGRADPKQNRVYNHMSDEEMVEKTALVMKRIQEKNAVELIHYIPVTQEEFDAYPRGPAHTTIWGACLRDLVMSPCDKHMDCLNCSDLLCIKRQGATKERIEARLLDQERQLTAAEAAMSEGDYGADRWYEHHKLAVARLKELVGLLNNPSVPEDSLIRLKNVHGYSPLRRALEGRRAIGSGGADDQLMLSTLMASEVIGNG
ncbi:hypothetical protein B6S59_01425 [Pseudomonas sp. A46]|nr:integrase [Pseudomonas sp. A46]OWJ98264.1 hypothetical protein B6S59_01425 [Pseudomonas sp. A46]